MEEKRKNLFLDKHGLTAGMLASEVLIALSCSDLLIGNAASLSGIKGLKDRRFCQEKHILG